MKVPSTKHPKNLFDGKYTLSSNEGIDDALMKVPSPKIRKKYSMVSINDALMKGSIDQ